MLNYKRIYDQLIEKRLTEKLYKSNDLYTENHHIVPRSLGGSDNQDNMIRLTAREHLIAHLLLVKIYEQSGDKNAYYKMLRAMSAMTNLTGDNYNCENKRQTIINSRVYQKIKEDIAKMYSEKFSGENNPNYGKRAIWNLKTLRQYYIDKDNDIPEGFTVVMPDCLRKTGKDSPTYNKAPIYNIETGEMKQLDKNETPPEGWKWGMSPEVKAKLKKAIVNPALGKHWVQNPTLKQRKLVGPDYVLEDGWEYGHSLNFIPKSENKDYYNKLRRDKNQQLKLEKMAVDPEYRHKVETGSFYKSVAEKEKLFSEYYKIYDRVGFDKFKEITGYKFTKQNLVSSFKRYVKEFVPQNGKRRGQ